MCTLVKALGSVTYKQGVVEHANNTNTHEVEAGESEVQCYLRLFIKTNKVKKEKACTLPGGSSLPWNRPQQSLLSPPT